MDVSSFRGCTRSRIYSAGTDKVEKEIIVFLTRKAFTPSSNTHVFFTVNVEKPANIVMLCVVRERRMLLCSDNITTSQSITYITLQLQWNHSNFTHYAHVRTLMYTDDISLLGLSWFYLVLPQAGHICFVRCIL